jgi:hypothetical protein
MHNLSSAYFVKNLYMFRAYRPTSGDTPYGYNNWYLLFFSDNRQSSKKNNKYQLLYPYGVPPDDGIQKHLKHVEVFDEIY